MSSNLPVEQTLSAFLKHFRFCFIHFLYCIKISNNEVLSPVGMCQFSRIDQVLMRFWNHLPVISVRQNNIHLFVKLIFPMFSFPWRSWNCIVVTYLKIGIHNSLSQALIRNVCVIHLDVCFSFYKLLCCFSVHSANCRPTCTYARGPARPSRDPTQRSSRRWPERPTGRIIGQCHWRCCGTRVMRCEITLLFCLFIN